MDLQKYMLWYFLRYGPGLDSHTKINYFSIFNTIVALDGHYLAQDRTKIEGKNRKNLKDQRAQADPEAVAEATITGSSTRHLNTA